MKWLGAIWHRNSILDSLNKSRPLEEESARGTFAGREQV